MDKKILIVGTAGDVIDKRRGEKINQYFDDILICNKSIFHIDEYSKYFGTPTIWGTCGWYNNDEIFDPTCEEKSKIYDIIIKNNISRVWCNSLKNINDLDFEIPDNVQYDNIVYPYKPNQYHSLGLQSILYAIKQKYSEICYLGIDSYRKSHHYYKEHMPSNVMTDVHSQSNYLYESKIIKILKKENKLFHIGEKIK